MAITHKLESKGQVLSASLKSSKLRQPTHLLESQAPPLSAGLKQSQLAAYILKSPSICIFSGLEA
jgi:hypothetical protein